VIDEIGSTSPLPPRFGSLIFFGFGARLCRPLHQLIRGFFVRFEAWEGYLASSLFREEPVQETAKRFRLGLAQ
jgi:hypothetical protein